MSLVRALHPLPFNACLFLQLLPQITREYLKEGYMEKTGPTVGQQCAQTMHPLMQWSLFAAEVLILCVCVLSATGAIQEEVVHTVLSEQKAYIL